MPNEIRAINHMVLISIKDSPFKIHWRNKKLCVAKLAQGNKATVTFIRSDSLAAYMHRSSIDVRCERDDQVMIAWLLQILIFSLCSPTQACPSSKRLAKNGPPFCFGVEVRGFF